MPIESVYISRVTDGLILVASMESASSDKLDLFKNQAKQLIKKLNNRSAAKMSVESNPYVFHYMIDNGICYLTLTDKAYPKRLVFLFLEDLAKDFTDSLKEEHGEENWMHNMETVGRQYAYIKFDRVIQKKRREYADPNSNANSKKINDDLQCIHNIMRKTIDDVLDRGNKLDDVSEMSKNLSSESKKYNWKAKQLSLLALYKQYAPFMVLGILVVVVIGIRFLW